MNSTTSILRILPKKLCPDLTFRDRLVQPVRQWLDSIEVGDPLRGLR